MNVALRPPRMTREQFLDWVERQEAPYEFDGSEPVAMTGGSRQHARLRQNLYVAIGTRLLGGSCELLPEAGVATMAGGVRYPDALITCTDGSVTDRLMPDPVVVFEVASPSTARLDRYIKLREYRAIGSIRRFVLIDHLGPDLMVHSRAGPGEDWLTVSLTAGDTLAIPEAGIEVPVDELFRGVTFES